MGLESAIPGSGASRDQEPCALARAAGAPSLQLVRARGLAPASAVSLLGQTTQRRGAARTQHLRRRESPGAASPQDPGAAAAEPQPPPLWHVSPAARAHVPAPAGTRPAHPALGIWAPAARPRDAGEGSPAGSSQLPPRRAMVRAGLPSQPRPPPTPPCALPGCLPGAAAHSPWPRPHLTPKLHSSGHVG